MLTRECQNNLININFNRQAIVIDILWEKTEAGKNELFSNLFLDVAKEYIKIHFTTTSMEDRRTLNVIDFDLEPTNELFELRKKIWQKIFQFYQITILKDSALNVFNCYVNSCYKVNLKEILEKDAAEIIPFIELKFDPHSYRCCLVVQDYLNRLEKHQVLFNDELRDRFTNQVYTLSKVLLFSRAEGKDSHLSYDEYEQLKNQQIKKYFANYDFSDYKEFFNHCFEIHQEVSLRNDNFFNWQSRVIEVLTFLADSNPDLYIEVIKHYLSLDIQFQMNGRLLVNKLINIYGVKETYELPQTNYFFVKT